MGFSVIVVCGRGTLLKQTAETNSFYSFRDRRVHTDGRTDRQTDMARLTRLLILKTTYTGRDKNFDETKIKYTHNLNLLLVKVGINGKVI